MCNVIPYIIPGLIRLCKGFLVGRINEGAYIRLIKSYFHLLPAFIKHIGGWGYNRSHFFSLLVNGPITCGGGRGGGGGGGLVGGWILSGTALRRGFL